MATPDPAKAASAKVKAVGPPPSTTVGTADITQNPLYQIASAAAQDAMRNFGGTLQLAQQQAPPPSLLQQLSQTAGAPPQFGWTPTFEHSGHVDVPGGMGGLVPGQQIESPVSPGHALMHNLMEGAVALAASTNAGRALQQQEYGPRAAQWAAKVGALSKAVGARSGAQATTQAALPSEVQELTGPAGAVAQTEGAQAQMQQAESGMVQTAAQAFSNELGALMKEPQVDLGEFQAAVGNLNTQLTKAATIAAAGLTGPQASAVRGQYQEAMTNLNAMVKYVSLHPNMFTVFAPMLQEFSQALPNLLSTGRVPQLQVPGGAVGGAQIPGMPPGGPGQGETAPTGAPPIGTIRTINGVRARWDGKGWLATGGK